MSFLIFKGSTVIVTEPYLTLYIVYVHICVFCLREEHLETNIARNKKEKAAGNATGAETGLCGAPFPEIIERLCPNFRRRRPSLQPLSPP